MNTSPQDLPQVSDHPEYTRGRNSLASYIQFLEQKIATLEAAGATPANPPPFELALGEVKLSKAPDTIQLRIGKLLGRRATTKWSNAEKKLYKEISPVDEKDLVLMERFYAVEESPDAKLYRRTTIERVLKYWNSEVDKSREYCRTHK